MNKPDAIYQDILTKDIDLYINLDDEDHHEIIPTNDTERVDILVWYK